MMKLKLQFFGGRGSAGGNRTPTDTSLNREFKPGDLKNPVKDQYGDNRYSNTTIKYGEDLIKTLKPGDVVDITRTNKDGTVLKTSVEVVSPEDMDSQNSKSEFPWVRNSESTAERYKDSLAKGTVVFVRRTGQSLDRIQDSTPDGLIRPYERVEFADLISLARSKVRSVSVKVRRRK